ncbi:hypothetical protein P1P91_00920 [Halomonas piscis]|uniref:Uncharacterized protein n=1 Tax=Halomonas piscis TaxID=3031727 RepID=A0ABY9YZL3_9GAMM|nr:hypothetical protein [Halomonas piscis]WNK20282.1 hypothetical protein P1P91_00920 [Halomonas piscis]
MPFLLLKMAKHHSSSSLALMYDTKLTVHFLPQQEAPTPQQEAMTEAPQANERVGKMTS